MSEKNEFLDSPTKSEAKKDDLDDSSIPKNEEGSSEKNLSEEQKENKRIPIEKKPIPKDKNEIIKQLIERLNNAEV